MCGTVAPFAPTCVTQCRSRNRVSPVKWNECTGSCLALNTIFTLPTISTDSVTVIEMTLLLLCFFFINWSFCAAVPGVFGSPDLHLN